MPEHGGCRGPRLQALQALLHIQEVTCTPSMLHRYKQNVNFRTSEGPEGRGEGRMHPLPEEEETVRLQEWKVEWKGGSYS